MSGCSVERPAENRVTQVLTRAAFAHRLTTVHWELTYRCNTRCIHCYAVKPGDPGFVAPAPELSTQECLALVDQLYAENALQILFSGGEILVRPDFFRIASYAREKRFLLRLLTNGTLITPEVADRIRDLCPISVEISLYGATETTHDGITQKPHSFAKVMRAFRLLEERGVRAIAKVPLMHENVGEFAAMKTMAQEMGVAVRHDTMIVAKDNGDLSPLHHRLTDEDLLSFLRHEMPADYQPRLAEGGDKHCFSGMHTLAIDPYGEVFPCIQTRHSAGNVRRQSIREIWRAAESLNLMRSIKIATFPICSTCELRAICNRCPGATEVEYGDLLGPNPEACRQSYFRYQVLQEKGALPAGDTPLPAAWKLRALADQPQIPPR